jgi:hypothetical protein
VVSFGQWFEIVVAPSVFLVAVPRVQKLGFDFGGELFAVHLLGEGGASEKYQSEGD